MSQAPGGATERSNPYSSPKSAVSLPGDLPPRPVSVIILQVVLVLCTAVYLFGFVAGIYAVMLSRMAAPWTYAPFLLLRALPLAFMATTFWALARRRPLGRWLGLLSILAFLALVVYSSLYPPSGPTLLPRLEVSNTAAEKVGAAFGQILVYTLIAWWFYSLGFSRKARAFFRRK